MKLFGRSTALPKNPGETIVTLKEALIALRNNKTIKDEARLMEDVRKPLNTLKSYFFGLEPGHSVDALLAQKAAKELADSGLIRILVEFFRGLNLECRSEISQLLAGCLRLQPQNNPVADVFYRQQTLFDILIKCFDAGEIAFQAGSILRACCPHPRLTGAILSSDYFFNFFEHMEDPCFDISAEAYSTFRAVLSTCKLEAAQFLSKYHKEFFTEYDKLLRSTNYLCKRQSLRLLGELLVERYNYEAMQRVVSDVENLKTVMNLLLNRAHSIQIEAFHVFKVFIANPQKPPLILDVLIRNKHRLIRFVTHLKSGDGVNSAFEEDKLFLLDELEGLPERDPKTRGKNPEEELLKFCKQSANF
ncbi:unnamed protein product, partial [Mesorhabditis spiculigera]